MVTTLKWAAEYGLEIQSECEVDHLVHEPNQVRVFGLEKGNKAEWVARRVILAAGALGNTAILIKSGLDKKLPAIGTRFTCHPQYMTYALFDQLVDAHKGAFQAVEGSDLRFRKAGLKFENVFAPPIATAMLLPGWGKPHHQLMKKYRFYASMEVAIRDEPNGRISISKNGKLVIDKPFTDQDRNKASEGLRLVNDFFKAAGAKQIIACPQSFGLHLMGGCPIGADLKTSVVNPEFTVHEHPNLYIADSSIFPSAPGINPSFTIMALSQKAAQMILKTQSKSIRTEARRVST